MDELCEICGRNDARYKAKIEGATLSVCEHCARGGKVVLSLYDNSVPSAPIKSSAGVPKSLNEEETLVEGYGKKIMQAREKKGLKREEFAKSINEMASYLEHIEREKTVPPTKVIHKIEKALGIRLMEKPSTELSLPQKQSQKKDLTLADHLDTDE